MKETLWAITKAVNMVAAAAILLALFWLPAYYTGKSNASLDCLTKQLSESKGGSE